MEASYAQAHAEASHTLHSTRTQVSELQSSIGAQNTYLKEAFSSNRSVQNNVLTVLITGWRYFQLFTKILFIYNIYNNLAAARRPQKAARALRGSSAQSKKFCLAYLSPLLLRPDHPPPARPSPLCTRHRCTRTRNS